MHTSNMALCYIAIIVTIVLMSGYNVAFELEQYKKPRGTETFLFVKVADESGFFSEVKDVITEDGYILTSFHIPGNHTRPVLLIHGNLESADCWIIRGNSSLALTLARQGYDVWAVNLRGSRYSRRHLHLDADTQPEPFFNFSFYEQGIYDLPATVDFILQETGQQQLIAVGHSIGTTVLYVMGSERPQYNDKIKIGIGLAPICFLEHLRGISSLASGFGPALISLLDYYKIHEVAEYSYIGPILRKICSQPLGYELYVQSVWLGMFGDDGKGIEAEFAPTLFEQYPAGCSLKIFKHLLQLIQKKKFVKFDYGVEKNLELYNRSEPSQFDLSKVTMKTALFMGREDFLGTVQDSVRLNESLPNVVHYQVLPYKKFNHDDFVWGRYMPYNLYPYLLDVIDKYMK